MQPWMDWPHVRSAILSRWPLHSLRDHSLFVKARIIIFYYNFNRLCHSPSLSGKADAIMEYARDRTTARVTITGYMFSLCRFPSHCYHHCGYLFISAQFHLTVTITGYMLHLPNSFALVRNLFLNLLLFYDIFLVEDGHSRLMVVLFHLCLVVLQHDFGALAARYFITILYVM